MYEACPGNIHTFWISRELVAWPSCNVAASHRRPYCAIVNSHFPVGLVSRQWDAVDWALCCVKVAFTYLHAFKGDFNFGKNQKSRATKSVLHESLHESLHDSLHENSTMGTRIDANSRICLFGDCESDGHTVQKLSQRFLTAEWLAPRESYCSRTRNEVSSGWMPSYIKVTGRVLEISKHNCHRTGSRNIKNG